MNPSSGNNIRAPWATDDDYDPFSNRTGASRGHSPRPEDQHPLSHQSPQRFELQSSESFAYEMLTAHNRYRAMHQAIPLKLDKTLTDGAQNWANMMASQDRVYTDPNIKNGHLGENLAMKYDSTRTNFSGAEFTDYWYNGISEYDFSNPNARLGNNSGALSFTQIIWKSTEMAGFGRAVSRQGRVYVVGRYYPPGNAIGEFNRNVLPVGAPIGPNRSPTAPPGLNAGSSDRFQERYNSRPPVGAIGPTDALTSSRTSTVYENDKTIVTTEEKFTSPDGSTYTRVHKTTYSKDR